MNLTKRNYHSRKASMHYVGSSQYKAFMSCSAKAMAELRGEYVRPESTALLQGQYLDTLFEHPNSRKAFERNNDILAKSGSNKGLPRKEFRDVQRAYDRIMSDPVMADLARNGEQQKILTGSIQGIPVKVMFDNIHKDWLVDRKLMANFEDKFIDGERKNWALAWNYDIQQAFYSTIYEQNYGERKPFILVGATKETVPRIGVFRFSEETTENALGLIRANIQRIDDMKKGKIEPPRCGVCDYCASTEKISSNSDDWLVI